MPQNRVKKRPENRFSGFLKAEFRPRKAGFLPLRRGIFSPPRNPFLRSPRPLPAGRENGASTDGIWDGFPGAETGRFWPSRRAVWGGFRGRKWGGKMLPKCRTSLFSAVGKMLPKCRTSAVLPLGRPRFSVRKMLPICRTSASPRAKIYPKIPRFPPGCVPN